MLKKTTVGAAYSTVKMKVNDPSITFGAGLNGSIGTRAAIAADLVIGKKDTGECCGN